MQSVSPCGNVGQRIVECIPKKKLALYVHLHAGNNGFTEIKLAVKKKARPTRLIDNV